MLIPIRLVFILITRNRARRRRSPISGGLGIVFFSFFGPEKTTPKMDIGIFPGRDPKKSSPPFSFTPKEREEKKNFSVIMSVTSADFAKFYKLQSETIIKEQNSEIYGLTKNERSKLRRLFGYAGGEEKSKSIKSAGAFTRQALQLENNFKEAPNEAQKKEEDGGLRMGDVPRIFTEVKK